MRVYSRSDTILILGLSIAAAVMFARPIARLLETAREVERSYGVALVPALLVLGVVLLLHLQNRRHEAVLAARASAAAAQATESRANEFERLVFFSEAVSRSLDLDSVRDAIIRHLPPLAGSDNAWVLVRTPGGEGWHVLVAGGRDAARAREVDLARETLAESAVAELKPVLTPPMDQNGHREMCLPLVAGTAAVGALGVPIADGDGAEGSDRRRLYETISAILALAIRNAALFQEVHENSLRDGLTGLFNRTYAIELLDGEARRARRSRAPVSVVIFDIDHFKDFNDRYGHLCGDAVLGSVGRRLREVLRSSDYKCRYGGEEFLLVLPDTPLESAQRVAENVRREIEGMPINYGDSTVSITGSFGVTAAGIGEIDTTAIIGRADAALYDAKHSGRNCVKVSLP